MKKNFGDKSQLPFTKEQFKSVFVTIEESRKRRNTNKLKILK